MTFGLHLPSTLQGYLFFVLCLLILAFTMALHITLSAENMRLTQRLNVLEEEYARTERINANLVWEISQSTSLATVNAEATRMGYIPLTEFKYVVTGGLAPSLDPAFDASRDAEGWSVEPSSENPVVVIPSTLQDVQPGPPQISPQALNPLNASSDGPIETPGIRRSPLTEVPAWRNSLTMQELRAAAGETMRWLQERLPRRWLSN